jgi:hypothetical protein
MDRRLTFPPFEKPPEAYTKSYFENMINMLNVLTTSLRNPGVGRQTTMTLTALPTNDYYLEPGSFFEVDGVVRVAVLYKAYLKGNSCTGSVGSVGTTFDLSVSAQGVYGTGAVGSSTIQLSYAVSGLSGTGSVGTVTVTV